MSQTLYEITQRQLKKYSDQLPVRSIILEVKSPVKQLPESVDGVLFLPHSPNVIIFCRKNKQQAVWLEWQHRDQVVDVYGFADPTKFGLSQEPGQEKVPRFNGRDRPLLEQLGPEFEKDLRSMQSHKALAAKWNVKHWTICYHRRMLGVKIQQERRNKGLTVNVS